MKCFTRLAATLVVCGLGALAQAQEVAPADVAADLAAFQRQLGAWPYTQAAPELPAKLNGYHPSYFEFCKTCYGGAHCGVDATCHRCGACAGNTCERDKIETCRRCGMIGRILFYECKRLGCGEKGGDGCPCRQPICVTDCCGRSRKVRPEGFARWLTGEPESAWAWIGNKPNYTYRFNCYGWKEGPVHWYGLCCGCYESFLWGHYDDRGPLNYNPDATSKCHKEDAIISDFEEEEREKVRQGAFPAEDLPPGVPAPAEVPAENGDAPPQLEPPVRLESPVQFETPVDREAEAVNYEEEPELEQVVTPAPKLKLQQPVSFRK